MTIIFVGIAIIVGLLALVGPLVEWFKGVGWMFGVTCMVLGIGWLSVFTGLFEWLRYGLMIGGAAQSGQYFDITIRLVVIMNAFSAWCWLASCYAERWRPVYYGGTRETSFR